MIVPDLATNTGVVSNGGKTYTFKLKPGVKFGPPLNRAITSKDVLYAFQRARHAVAGRAVRLLLRPTSRA